MGNAAPNTPYIDAGKDQPTKAMSDSTKKLVDDGWNIKQRIDVLNAELKQINSKLIKKHPGVSLVVPGQCRCPVARSTSVKIKGDVGIVGLKDYWGNQFKSLVTRTVSHTPTTELKNIAQNEHHEHYAGVIEFMNITHGVYGIRWNTSK